MLVFTAGGHDYFFVKTRQKLRERMTQAAIDTKQMGQIHLVRCPVILFSKE